MKARMTERMAWGAFALAVVLGAFRQAQAQIAKTPYPSMALPGAPVMLGQQLPGAPVTDFLIPVAKWSDGTAAPTDAY